jgi:hypothetical protein
MTPSDEKKIMTAMQPQPQSKKYDVLFTGIDSGQVKLPMFQREFVWGKEQTAKLIDSIIKGYPIGTFILWKTREELRSVRDIGNINLPEPPKGDAVHYILDGQQRITSLYAVRKGAIITREGEQIDYKEVTINLQLDPNDSDQIVFVEAPEGVETISVHKLLNGTVTEFAKDYLSHLNKIDTYRSRLLGYDFSTVVIEDYPIDIACDVFTRINTGGTELTLFEIMIAKTFDNARGFDLAEKYQNLIDSSGNSKDLEDANFDTLPSSTVLQCVAACMVGQIRRKDILKIGKDDFINIWEHVVDSLFTAVDFVRSYLRTPVSQLLPYNALLIPITYFFFKNKNKHASNKQSRLLSQYFWWASLSTRYSSGLENKIAQDLARMDKILAGENPSYRGEEVNLTMDNLKYKWFSTGDAFCKAILCLYAYHVPHSFKDDSLVQMDNSWLKVSISKNYHHFFPKAFLRNKGLPNWQINTILNITIVDDHMNKREIRTNPPSKYMKTFKKTNKKLAETMKSHLIIDLDTFGIWENDYETFLEQRGKVVLKELKQRLEPELDD